MSRIIQLNGEINEALYNHFTAKLEQLIDNNPNKPITLEISSHGGMAHFGLAIYDKIFTCPVPVNTVAYGQVMSAATIILAAGAHRAAGPETWFMTHESPDYTKKASISEKKQFEREEMQWARILASHTNVSQIEWRKMSKKTTYLNAHEMLQVGVIDTILKRGPL